MKDLMRSPVYSLPPYTPLNVARHNLVSKKFRHLPVVSDEGMIEGIVSERDLLRAIAAQHQLDSEPHAVLTLASLMRTKVLTVTEDTPIREAASVIFDERVGCLPVVQGTLLVGIMTRSDILRALVSGAPLELWI